MIPRRILVATPPLSPGEPPLSAGVLRAEGRPGIALVVKAAFTFAGGDVRPAGAPAALRLATDGYPSDLVPRKTDADVLLVGHAYAEYPSTSIDASIDVDGIVRAFTVTDTSPLDRLLLTAEHSAATLDERVPVIMPGARVELTGLSPRARRLAFELPALSPRASLESRGRRPIAVDLVCDTLWIDTDRELLEIVWRGSVAGEIERVVLWWSHLGAPRELASAEPQLARGSFAYAIEERDLAGGAGPDAREAAELLRARYAAWTTPPEPVLTVERYAEISAEVQEKREPLHETLRRHQLDEDWWMVEERAWMEAMSAGAMKGDASLAVRYGELFLAAQDALATPAEQARTLDDYAPIKAAMLCGGDPARVLAGAGLTLPVWMRLERRFAAEARADVDRAVAIDRRVAEAAEVIGEIPDEPSDDLEAT
jgi:hypothetical protein